LEENALQKAQYIFNRFNKPCFADDTGLEINALNGKPGVYSARYGGTRRNADDNIKKVLREMEGKTDRGARFRTVIAYLDKNERKIFEGIIKGKIITSKRGKSGFGYDPVFIPEGYDITFAEMNLAEKNKISHRALAFNQLKIYLTSLPS
jgi:XTP/dITP diphosphohydrolase